MEEQIVRGQKWLEDTLALMGVKAGVQVAKMTGEDEDPLEYWLVIDHSQLSPQEIELLEGEKGENIDALQYMVNTLLNIGMGGQEQRTFIIELNGYRIRRRAELKNIAYNAALNARSKGRAVVENLSSADRRQVHTFLKDQLDLETSSTGQEPHRKLVVRMRTKNESHGTDIYSSSTQEQ